VKISTCHSTGRTEVAVFRMLDGERRTLVIMCPWGQPLAETMAKVRPQLTDTEAMEVALAFGLDGPDGGDAA
jgi:hypothetical protein